MKHTSIWFSKCWFIFQLYIFMPFLSKRIKKKVIVKKKKKKSKSSQFINFFYEEKIL